MYEESFGAETSSFLENTGVGLDFLGLGALVSAEMNTGSPRAAQGGRESWKAGWQEHGREGGGRGAAGAKGQEEVKARAYPIPTHFRWRLYKVESKDPTLHLSCVLRSEIDERKAERRGMRLEGLDNGSGDPGAAEIASLQVGAFVQSNFMMKIRETFTGESGIVMPGTRSR